MENYLKTVLYAYPLLKTVGEDYEQHIRNKAVLSYDGKWDTLRLAEYLAEEILQKNRLEWLKGVVERVLDKRRKGEDGFSAWSDRKYFRMQQRTGEKVGAMLKTYGVTKSKFFDEFASFSMIQKVHSFVESQISSS